MFRRRMKFKLQDAHKLLDAYADQINLPFWVGFRDTKPKIPRMLAAAKTSGIVV